MDSSESPNLLEIQEALFTVCIPGEALSPQNEMEMRRVTKLATK
jgi:hypothetical protein